MLLTVVAFVVALGVLIAIHEWGHYRMAVACGVKVLRFSVGFGRPVLRWKRRGSDTEFVIGLLPFLGGYVRMLDEREGPVPADQRHLAFNNQRLRSRAAIVAAGPAANLLLAVLLYSLVGWIGVQEPVARLAAPSSGSLMQLAGMQAGDKVERMERGDQAWEDVRSLEGLRWGLTRAALEGEPVRLQVRAHAPQAPLREVALDIASLQTREPDARFFQRLGLTGPWTPAQLSDLVPGEAAQRAGLREGDKVLRVGDTPISDGAQLHRVIRAQGSTGTASSVIWHIERDGEALQVAVQPQVQPAKGEQAPYGRVGAYVGGPAEMVLVRRGPIEGLWAGVKRTWDLSSLTVRMIGRMLVGQASLKNISGPLTIADYAGKSASLGLVQYLSFLALISVSLGVLNLLPLPVLDGGHLMYYLWEGVTGRSVSEAWMDRLQRAGVVVLLLMMSVAFFNDINRLLG